MSKRETPPTAFPSPLPVSSTAEPKEREDDDSPVITGTLFIMVLFLMSIFGGWVMIYLSLLER